MRRGARFPIIEKKRELDFSAAEFTSFTWQKSFLTQSYLGAISLSKSKLHRGNGSISGGESIEGVKAVILLDKKSPSKGIVNMVHFAPY